MVSFYILIVLDAIVYMCRGSQYKLFLTVDHSQKAVKNNAGQGMLA